MYQPIKHFGEDKTIKTDKDQWLNQRFRKKER